MANLQSLEQLGYSSLKDYFILLERRGWVSESSVNNILVLLFSIQFWWKYSVLMEEKDIEALQRMLRCLGVDCLIPHMSPEMHDKVVINKRSFDTGDIATLMSELNIPLMSEKAHTFLIPEKNQI